MIEWSAKRIADLILASLLLSLLLPSLAACAVAVWIGDGRRTLFGQDRDGRGGGIMPIVTPRTMRADAGPPITESGGSRVTRSGRTNIGTSVHYMPVHMRIYRDKYSHAPDDLPVARDAFHRMVTLPRHSGLSNDDGDDVIGAVLDVRRTFSQ